MNEISMYEAQKKKMQGLCDEHELTYRFKKDSYPITFTIRPLQGLGAQLTMLEEVEENGYISPDASMTWIFEDGNLQTKVTGGTFTISKTLRTKIESVLTKMIAYWQQYFFRDVMEKNSLRSGLMPVIDEDEADDDSTGEDTEEESVCDIPDSDDMEDDIGEVPGENSENDDAPESIHNYADDAKVQEAIKIVRMENKATPALLQRRMNIGYSKAAKLICKLEDMGIIGPYNGAEPREVLPVDVPDEEDGENE